MQQKLAGTVQVELILEVYGGCIGSSRQVMAPGSARLVQPITFCLLGGLSIPVKKSGLPGSSEPSEATFVALFRPNCQRVAVSFGAKE